MKSALKSRNSIDQSGGSAKSMKEVTINIEPSVHMFGVEESFTSSITSKENIE